LINNAKLRSEQQETFAGWINDLAIWASVDMYSLKHGYSGDFLSVSLLV
jgi:hypothetical protein